jgi:hypothetical protein
MKIRDECMVMHYFVVQIQLEKWSVCVSESKVAGSHSAVEKCSWCPTESNIKRFAQYS